MQSLSKSDLRKMFLEKRKNIPQAQKLEADKNIFEFFFKNVTLQEGAIVAGYWSINGEVDVLPILKELLKRGHVCVLPHTEDKNSPLEFYEWHEDTPMIKGKFDIAEPAVAKKHIPDIILTPLSAFDVSGHRLGYGAGLYDRTIAGIKENKSVLTIGVGYKIQLCNDLPIEETDVKMDMIITDKEIYITK